MQKTPTTNPLEVVKKLSKCTEFCCFCIVVPEQHDRRKRLDWVGFQTIMSRRAWWDWAVRFIAEGAAGALRVTADRGADRATEQRVRHNLPKTAQVTCTLIPSAKSDPPKVLSLLHNTTNWGAISQSRNLWGTLQIQRILRPCLQSSWSSHNINCI